MEKQRKMKKMLFLTLIGMMLFQLAGIHSYAEEPYSNYTKISDAEGLMAINNDLNGKYVLTADIDLTELTKEEGAYDNGGGWTPLADGDECFTGVLDGNGHRIKGMHIYGELTNSRRFAGLFAKISNAVIKNVGMSDVDIQLETEMDGFTTLYSVGSLVGDDMGEDTVISGCWSDGMITVSSQSQNNAKQICIGGIAGRSNCIQECYSNIHIRYQGVSASWVTQICGIGGKPDFGNSSDRGISNSYFSGEIIYDIDEVDGFYVEPIGSDLGSYDYDDEEDMWKSQQNCYYLKGRIKDSDGNMLYKRHYHGEEYEYQGISRTPATMQFQNGFTGFDFTNTWIVDKYSTYSYPQLTHNMQQRIEGIDLIEEPDQKEYIQGENINLTGAEVQLIYEGGYSTKIIPTSDMVVNYDPKKIGEQQIDISYCGVKLENAFKVEVKEVPVEKVEISAVSASVRKGNTLQLKAVVSPANATDQSLEWKIVASEPKVDTGNVAEIDNNGLVKGLSAGQCTVQAIAKSGKYAEYKVNVTVPAAVIYLNKNDVTLRKGDTEQYSVTVSPLDTTDKITFISSNKDIVSVTENGLLTANHAGSATVTAKAESGVSSVCSVKVMEPLDTFKIIGLYDAKYTGKTITQKFTVTDGADILKENIDYNVSYKNNEDVGTAKVTVSGIGFYEGTISSEFKITGADVGEDVAPEKVSVSSVKNKKSKSFTVSWKAQNVKGYEVQYALNKKFTKSRKTKATTKLNMTVKKLKKGKTYYIRVRAYNVGSDNTKSYGKWSSVKKIKVKK